MLGSSMMKCVSENAVRLRPVELAFAGLVAVSTLAASAAIGCGSTEFIAEGPGAPNDRATGTVPSGMIGVCRRPFSRKPPIVNPTLWEHAKVCNSSTPSSFIRLGYGHQEVVETEKKVGRMMEALKEGPRQEGGNTKLLSMLRQIRSEGETDPYLRDRVFKQSARTSVCDFTYLLNTMEEQSSKLKQGDRCAARAFDQKDKQEVCLFDTNAEEAVWLTSTWACMTRTGEIGNTESCHRLCAYDDYCSRQVSCAAPDVDLTLCALGVCLPQSDGVIY
jgi:hypothetical protein